MKFLSRLLLFCIFGWGAVFAQSNLPECRGRDTSKWNNCLVNLIFPDGSNYQGEVKEGKRNGQGTYTEANGDKYVGEWKDEKYNGQGTHTFANGNKYVGEYKEGRGNGQATFTSVNGEKYVGEYKNSKRNGKGTLYSSNGSIISQGIWADDRFVRSAPVQQAKAPNQEINRLSTEVTEAKRKQAEAEEKMRVAQQQAPQTAPVTIQSAMLVGKRLALVVGNKNYKVRPLQNSLNDADDIFRSLRTSGFEVIDLRDATLPQMRTAVRQFGDKLLTYDVGLVYYSGHGVEVKGRNYFIPVNADILAFPQISRHSS